MPDALRPKPPAPPPETPAALRTPAPSEELPPPALDDGAIAISTHDAGYTKPSSPDEVPLRKLTPEEKAARRLRRNIIMAAVGLTILIVTLGILLQIVGD